MQIKVFHGTTTRHASHIFQDGFSSGTYVTVSEDLAWYYAEAAFDEDNDGENDDETLI